MCGRPTLPVQKRCPAISNVFTGNWRRAFLRTREVIHYILTRARLPAPGELATDRVRIYPIQQQRLPGCRGDYLNIVAPRSAIRQLGLLVLAVLFHEQWDRSTLDLTRSDSVVKHIVTDYKHWSKSQVSGFRFRPWVLGYVPEDVNHAFVSDDAGSSAPLLRLTNLSDCQRNENDWRNRDVLHWVGGAGATADVAEFLLNAGRESATWKSFTIPPNGAFFTAEAKFWIPEHWEESRRRLHEAVERSKQSIVGKGEHSCS